jgi:hypothetical protein
MEGIKKILKYIVLYSKKEEMRLEINRYIELIILEVKRLVSIKMIERKRLLSRISRLERVNHINDYKLISYNWNKNTMIMKSIISKLIIKLLENIINGVDLKWKGKKVSGGSIIISKPVIKENLNSVKILFYYFLPNNKSYRLLNRMNTFISKLKDNKELELLMKESGKNYSKDSIISHDELIISKILNDILNNRNNVLNTNINNININDKNIEIKKNNNNNILDNNILNILDNRLKNNTMLNISILNKRESILKNSKENELNISNLNWLNNIENSKSSLLSSSSLNNISLIRKLHTNENKLILNRKDLINNYLLKTNNNLNISSELDNNKLNLLKLNKENDNLSKYMVSYVDILLNKICGSSSNSLKLIISKYFGLKEVEIEGINLKYEFNNPEILLKLIRKGIAKRTRTLSRMFRFRLTNRIPLLNDKIILKNKISENVLKTMELNNNILHTKNTLIENLLTNYNNNNNDLDVDAKDLYNNVSLSDNNDLRLNNDILYKNIVGWSLLLKGKVGARKGKNRSNRILITKGSFKNNNILIKNILEGKLKYSGYSKDRLKLNYIKNSNFISYMDKSTNNGKLGITLKVNIL